MAKQMVEQVVEQMGEHEPNFVDPKSAKFLNLQAITKNIIEENRVALCEDLKVEKSKQTEAKQAQAKQAQAQQAEVNQEVEQEEMVEKKKRNALRNEAKYELGGCFDYG